MAHKQSKVIVVARSAACLKLQEKYASAGINLQETSIPLLLLIKQNVYRAVLLPLAESLVCVSVDEYAPSHISKP